MRIRRNAPRLGALLVAALAVGCRRDMSDQPRYEPLQASGFFDDRRSARPLLDDTVPRTRDAIGDEAEGLFADPSRAEAVETLPMPLTRALLDRGRERHDVFCAPCHDRTGSGLGMVVRRGYKQPVSYHVDRIRDATIGHLWVVTTAGIGEMPGLASQIPPNDRWAIAAFVRALQWSQCASLDDVPVEEQKRLAALVQGAGR
ncbi:MAG: cytochrome c [Planctomycetes bacterium]|nr:cytochrome c [Planctomycetota bacterium]